MLGTIPMTTGGNNSVTLTAANLPDHSHKGGAQGRLMTRDFQRGQIILEHIVATTHPARTRTVTARRRYQIPP